MCFPENLTLSISAIAAAIAQGRATEEIDLMAAVFTQLGDTLATISAARGICENTENRRNPNKLENGQL